MLQLKPKHINNLERSFCSSIYIGTPTGKISTCLPYPGTKSCSARISTSSINNSKPNCWGITEWDHLNIFHEKQSIQCASTGTHSKRIVNIKPYSHAVCFSYNKLMQYRNVDTQINCNIAPHMYMCIFQISTLWRWVCENSILYAADWCASTNYWNRFGSVTWRRSLGTICFDGL